MNHRNTALLALFFAVLLLCRLGRQKPPAAHKLSPHPTASGPYYQDVMVALGLRMRGVMPVAGAYLCPEQNAVKPRPALKNRAGTTAPKVMEQKFTEMSLASTSLVTSLLLMLLLLARLLHT